jgi:hypothetical protein
MELTLENAQELFITQYKADTPEMRVWLENTVREKLRKQFERGDMTGAQYAQGQIDIEELIGRARASVEGVQADA